MGHLCSCHRAERASCYKGKAASHDPLLSSPRFNGLNHVYQPLDRHRLYNGYYGMPSSSSSDNMLTEVSYAPGSRSMSMRLPSPRKSAYSTSTLSPESGFSSKASSTLDTTSAPSSPRTVMRRKPPPKPPRMRNHNVDGRLANSDTLSLRTPTPSLHSTDVSTLKSSIVDVTNALDSTLSRSFDDDDIPKVQPSPMVKRYNVSSQSQSKVYNILAQTKEFLGFELEPDGLLRYLTEVGVISKSTELDIRRTRRKQDRCDYVIDAITAKGPDEFGVFCQALRTVGNQSYLADFLEVLDALVDIATSNVMKPTGVEDQKHSPNMRLRAFSFAVDKQCLSCMCNNNCTIEEVSKGEGSFDIDISYINRDTGQTRSIQDVASMKRRKRPLSMTSEDYELLEESDRLIPMLSVSLYDQCLVHRGIDTISHILTQYPCVRELALVKNHLDDANSIGLLGSALEKNRNLVSLDLRLNNIGDEGSTLLAQGIAKNTSLRVLNVASTGLHGYGSGQLIQGVAKSTSLTELDIGYNEMSEQACEALCQCLIMNTSLRKLRVRSNNITPYGARCIFKGLKRNSRVHFLDISRNKIKDESILMFSEVLLLNRTLREVNFENCAITGEGCAAVARALKTNTSLRSLDLSMNSVENSGAKAVSEGLKYNHALDTLCLNMCNIGNQGFLYLLDAMRFNNTIKTLKLCYNKIGKDQIHSNIVINLKNLVDMTSSHTYSNSLNTSPTSPTLSSPSQSFMSTTSPQMSSASSQFPSPSSPSGYTRLPSFSPSTPLSPLTGSRHHPLAHYMCSFKDPMEHLYDTLCDVLQQNKDLKVLLWGNNFDESQDSHTNGR